MKDKENLVRLNEIAVALNKRWPENKIEPSLDRILALVDALGSPHLTYPTIHIAGTNGKTSTARMIDQLLANLGYRVGRYTSPHLESFTERISIKGEPISDLEMIKTYEDIHLYLDLIDSRQSHPISYFEALTAMAFVAFAEHPVDIAVIEAGMGGQWDATNVISSQVSVMTPIGLDHMEYLGNTVEAIAQTKAGIFKPESNVVLAAQSGQVAKVLLAQVAKVSAQAAVEVFAGVKLDTELVQDAFSKVSSPGRCEIVYKDPTVIIDAAHNPHGVSAIANTLNTEFDFELVVGVVAVLADKDVAGILKNLSTTLDYLVITENGSARAMNKDELAKIATQYFKAEQVEIIGDMNTAITYAIEKVALFNQVNDGVAAVVITGSVATAGMARSIIKGLARVK